MDLSVKRIQKSLLLSPLSLHVASEIPAFFLFFLTTFPVPLFFLSHQKELKWPSEKISNRKFLKFGNSPQKVPSLKLVLCAYSFLTALLRSDWGEVSKERSQQEELG